MGHREAHRKMSKVSGRNRNIGLILIREWLHSVKGHINVFLDKFMGV